MKEPLTNNRPETESINRRHGIESTSQGGCGVKQKNVRTTIIDSEVVILAHQKEGWRYYCSVPQGCGEILLIFER